MKGWIWLCAIAAVIVVGGLMMVPQADIPACRGEYSQAGDEAAVRQLFADAQDAAELVQDKGDIFLLSEFREARESRNFRAMETWLCRAVQKHDLK